VDSQILLDLKLCDFNCALLGFCELDVRVVPVLAHIVLHLLQLLQLVFVLRYSLGSSVVILYIKINPLTCLLRDKHHRLVVCLLSVCEVLGVALPILRFEKFETLIAEALPLGFVLSEALVNDHRAQGKVIFKFHGAICFGCKVAVVIKLVPHSELGILVLWLGGYLGAAPQKA